MTTSPLNQSLSPAIAIVGMACRYADAASPTQLWENILAQRQAFRVIPKERLNLADYFSPNHQTPDTTYSQQAALIEGYEFDRIRFRISGSTFRAADLTHWLALDIASQALADAGFTDGENLPRTSTGVMLGNTLTGEFSRANSLRLRWPYVRRVVESQLVRQDWSAEQRQQFLEDLERVYKQPFPAAGDETLAGNLSNTIAGRICNHFKLQGGCYTVDGACSSSLLAIAQACSALTLGDLDVALAGGVDLSLDPFELVGFAKVGALATQQMHVYDTNSAGFFPGEGCGMVVLMRYEDAIAQQRQIYAIIRGWGISSDGGGGITRPEVEGQLLALQRAYRRAGFGIDTVAYFEGHGTGTSVGDTVELTALSLARQQAAAEKPAVIGSIKANIGHTKAAAGVAGVIKAAMAVHSQILPPTTGCKQPHPQLVGKNPALQVLNQGKAWSVNQCLRAGVSAMGFGGINTHIVLEGAARENYQSLGIKQHFPLHSYQDGELFLWAASNTQELKQQIEHLLTFAPKLSRSQITDLAGALAKELNPQMPVKAAIAADNPGSLTTALEILQLWLKNGVNKQLARDKGVFLATSHHDPRIGFLFPGQAAPVYLQGGIWSRRFQEVQELYHQAKLPKVNNLSSTAVAQPAIATASIAGVQILTQLGITAQVAVGHSLGELSALYWAGAIDATALWQITKVRGQAMAQLGSPTGTMASIRASQTQVQSLINGEKVVIAGLNSPRQTIISGEKTEVETVLKRGQNLGLKTLQLPVSHAFHSPLVAAAASPLAQHLAQENFRSLQGQVVSTITGSPLGTNADLRSLLIRQVTEPVRFLEAISQATKDQDVELFLEVGPGRILSGLVADIVDIPVVSIDAGGTSLTGLLQAVGAAFVLGAPIKHQTLFWDRFLKPFNFNWQPQFFTNPCEFAPKEISKSPELEKSNQEEQLASRANPTILPLAQRETPESSFDTNPLNLVRQIIAAKTELPPQAVQDTSHLLRDLHLNSITVGELVAQAHRCLGLSPPKALTDYADATVAEIAQALREKQEMGDIGRIEPEQTLPLGVESWIRPFTVELVPCHLKLPPQTQTTPGTWQIIAPDDYPLTSALKQAFAKINGAGVVVCLPPEPGLGSIELLLQGAQAVLAEKPAPQFVLVQHGGGGAAFARTLHLEAPQITTCVVDIPITHPQVSELIVSEAQAAQGYVEAHYDASGLRRVPVLCLLADDQQTSIQTNLTPHDVLLVTGGGKGIAAECALGVAKETGVRLALLGRSQVEKDPELTSNLERMHSAGIEVVYLSADVTDAGAVSSALGKIEAELGSITAIIHGAGVNTPKLIKNLTQQDFERTLAPKVQGLHHVLAAVNADKLKLLVTFGSIIACTGLPGEADYALANEWLDRMVAKLAIAYPHCNCLNLAWSVWSGTGMGQRLGRIDTLMQQGITPIPTDVGINLLHHFITHPPSTPSVVVTGRFGEPPTLKMEQPELPLLRFLEQPRVHYPGVELVVDAELSLGTDPYLNEHVFQGEQILPGVMGLEAMAQVVMALLGTDLPPSFQDIQFHRPVVVPETGAVKIRIAAIVQTSGQVKVVLRSEQTAFSIDHFQATASSGVFSLPSLCEPIDLQLSTLPLNPHSDLYGSILFHSGRFQRLDSYRHLRATECIAQITADSQTQWFSSYLPQQLVLGDPGARDAYIHALQACLPHVTLLPVAVEKIIFHKLDYVGTRYVVAQERSRQDNTLIYDLQIWAENGELIESWQGLHLRAIQAQDTNIAWIVPLVTTYVERRLQELIPTAKIRVAMEQDTLVNRQVRRDLALQSILDSEVAIYRRLDGKPEVTDEHEISVSHTQELTLVVASKQLISCDLEPVINRSEHMWQDLLGRERFQLAQLIAQEVGESLDYSATRLWNARECLKKAGTIIDSPLIVAEFTTDGWVLLQGNTLFIASCIIRIKNTPEPMALAILSAQQAPVRSHFNDLATISPHNLARQK